MSLTPPPQVQRLQRHPGGGGEAELILMTLTVITYINNSSQWESGVFCGEKTLSFVGRETSTLWPERCFSLPPPLLLAGVLALTRSLMRRSEEFKACTDFLVSVWSWTLLWTEVAAGFLPACEAGCWSKPL